MKSAFARNMLTGVSVFALAVGLSARATAQEAPPNLTENLEQRGWDITIDSAPIESASIDVDSDEGLVRPLSLTPANPGASLNLYEMLIQQGYDVTIENIIPMMNWRDNLGSPVGQFDNSNTRASVGQINMVRSDTSASLGYCSGTLINSRFFLTAAHCVRDGVTPAALVRAGINFSASTDFTFGGASNRQAVGVITPGTYNPSQFFLGQDLAIVALDRPVYNIAGSPIATTQTFGQQVEIAGYGLAGTGSLPNQIFDGRRRLGNNTNEGVYILDGLATGTVIAADLEDPLNVAATNTLGLLSTTTTREAAVAPGDSGGPIFDSAGRVLGVASGVITIGISDWGYGSIPFWTNLSEPQYQAFIGANDPLQVSTSASTGLWSAPASWSGGIIPDNTFGASDDAFGIANYATNQRFYNVTISGAHAITLADTREVDQLSITNSAALSISAGGGDLGFWGASSTNGLLNVNGILRSFDASGYGSLTVTGVNAILSGSGSVLSHVNNTSGLVAPGNSIGTLSVSDYMQGPNGYIGIELTNGASDVLAVTNNASLAGTARFSVFGAAPLLGQSYNFITSGGTVSGHFSMVEDFLPGALFPSVSYGTNFVQVTLVDFCYFASGPVETPVCEALGDNAVQSDPDMLPALAGLQQLDPSLIPTALEALNPTRANAQSMIGLVTADLLRNQFGRRSHDLFGTEDRAQVAQRDVTRAQLASSSPSPEALAAAASAAIALSASAPSNYELSNGYGLFLAGDVAMFQTDQAGAIGKDTADAAALTIGIDHSSSADFVAGVAVSYLQSNVDQNYGLGGDTNSNGVALSAYATIDHGAFYADLYASSAWQSFETERRLLLAPHIFGSASGETDASQIQAGATLGYSIAKSDRMSVGAVGGLYYVNLDVDGYTETGVGPLGATISARSIDSLKAQLGGEVALKLASDNNALVPIMRVVWNHEFSDDPLSVTAGFAGASAVTFAAPGPSLGSDWATLGLGVSGNVSEHTNFYIRFQQDVGREGQQNQEVSAAARFGF